MSRIAPKQNVFKFKIAPHKQKSIVKNLFGRKKPPPPLANGAMCLSTPMHNGKSGTARIPLKRVVKRENYSN